MFWLPITMFNQFRDVLRTNYTHITRKRKLLNNLDILIIKDQDKYLCSIKVQVRAIFSSLIQTEISSKSCSFTAFSHLTHKYISVLYKSQDMGYHLSQTQDLVLGTCGDGAFSPALPCSSHANFCLYCMFRYH